MALSDGSENRKLIATPVEDGAEAFVEMLNSNGVEYMFLNSGTDTFPILEAMERMMEQERAVVGGEGNGGVILPELHYTRDAPVGAVLVLQHLLDVGSTLREARERWPSYRIVKRKVNFPRERVVAALAALATELVVGESDVSDGLWLAWSDRKEWLHVRASGTEPVVRVIAEAPSEAAAERLVGHALKVLAVSVGS